MHIKKSKLIQTCSLHNKFPFKKKNFKTKRSQYNGAINQPAIGNKDTCFSS